jgi:hypothetical protein
MGSTHSGASTPQWATIEDSAKEYLTTSSGEGGADHLSPRRCDLTLGTERVMMLDFTSTQALAKELAPPVHRGEARAEAAEANSTSTSPPLTTTCWIGCTVN